MNFQNYIWYSSEDHNLEYELSPLKDNIIANNQTVIVKYENGVIEENKFFYYRGNVNTANQYKVAQFMIISLK